MAPPSGFCPLSSDRRLLSLARWLRHRAQVGSTPAARAHAGPGAAGRSAGDEAGATAPLARAGPPTAARSAEHAAFPPSSRTGADGGKGRTCRRHRLAAVRRNRGREQHSHRQGTAAAEGKGHAAGIFPRLPHGEGAVPGGERLGNLPDGRGGLHPAAKNSLWHPLHPAGHATAGTTIGETNRPAGPPPTAGRDRLQRCEMRNSFCNALCYKRG